MKIKLSGIALYRRLRPEQRLAILRQRPHARGLPASWLTLVVWILPSYTVAVPS